MFSKTHRRQKGPTPEELVERIAKRDELAQAALRELYNRYAATLFAIALRLLGKPEDAEEILQETFLEVWKRAPGYTRTKASVSTWVMLICRSRALDRVRTLAASRRMLTTLQRQPLPNNTMCSETGLRDRERREALRMALASLPPEQHEAIGLAFGQGLTQVQISDQLGIPLGTVKTRTYLAMKKLRQSLGPWRSELL